MQLQEKASPYRPGKFTDTLERSFLLWEKPFAAGFFAFVIFLFISSTVGSPWRVTDRAYFNLLSDAFLHGQLNLRLIPSSTLDLSFFQGKYYLYWGPFPALIILPFVALFGTGVSDVLQSIVFGSLSTVVFAALLRQVTNRSLVSLSTVQRALLVLFFTLGTAHTPLPAIGKVWYLAAEEMLFFTILAYLTALSFTGWKAFFLTGCAISGILLTRMNAVLAAIFLVWYLLSRHWRIDRRRLTGYCFTGLMPVFITLCLLALYNQLRFGNPLETGMVYQLMHPDYWQDFARYGIFNLHYLPTNLYYNLIYYPFASLITQGWMVVYGGGLFLLSPLLLAAVYAVWQERKNPDMWFLLLSVACASIPIFLLIGPTYQFGPRYTLDFTAPLLLMTAMGIRRWPNALVSVLVGASVIQYLVGALMYVRF